MHGHGLQTWEHSPEFALRSYLYLGLHYLVAKPISMLAGDAQGKLVTFIGTRVALGTASAASEAWLCAEVARINPFAGAMLTALLVWPGRYCLPRRRVPFDSMNEGVKSAR